VLLSPSLHYRELLFFIARILDESITAWSFFDFSFLFQAVMIYDAAVHTVCCPPRINSMNYVMSVTRFSENASSTIHKLRDATIVGAHKICAISLMHYSEGVSIS
jgi:hypothetical protein